MLPYWINPFANVEPPDIDPKTGKFIIHMKVVNNGPNELNPLPVLTPLSQRSKPGRTTSSRFRRQGYVLTD